MSVNQKKFLILAGGGGTRLWPLSTEELPKQFQSFFDDRTLLQMAFDRISDIDPNNIYISTNKKYRDLVTKQLPEIPQSNIIAEPCKRDTGPCIAFAMKYIQSHSSKDTVVTILNADQLIKDEVELRKLISVSQTTAYETSKLVLISVETKFPNPNLGYIKVKDLKETRDSVRVYSLEQFVEKPSIKKAQKYHRSKKYFWNTAIFTWRIDVFMKHLKEHSNDIHNVLITIKDFNNCNDQYERFNKISIDYALLEKVSTDHINVLIGKIGWSDIGTWKTMFDESNKDKNHNLVKGKFRYSNVKNSVLINQTDTEAVAYNFENKFYVITKTTSIVGDLNDSPGLKRIVQSFK